MTIKTFETVNKSRIMYAVLTDDRTVLAMTFDQWLMELKSNESGDLEPVRVGEDTINGHWISTVFIGINQNFSGVPQWFETLVFDKDEDSSSELWGARASTWEEAEANHAEAIERVKANDHFHD